MPNNHKLKTVAPFFQALWDGKKQFELRKNDRDYKVGDRLYLYEFDAAKCVYSGRVYSAEVGYVLNDTDYPMGLMPDYTVLGFTDFGQSAWFCDPSLTDEDCVKKVAFREDLEEEGDRDAE